jgi:glycerol-3-phosphate acyltransferase PlsY
VIALNKSEYARKSIHVFSSLIPLAYMTFPISKILMLGVLGFLILFAIGIETIRKNTKFGQNIFERYFNFMLRDFEVKDKLTGATCVLIGMFISILIFQKYVAVMAILFMVFGDTFAALTGKIMPIGKIGSKTLSGTMGGLLACLFIVFEMKTHIPFSNGLGGAFVAMGVELLPISLDDNITIPLSSGLVITFLSGGFA